MALAVLFVGGGTLGSVTPLLAIVEWLKKTALSAVFWGTRTGPERALVEAAGIPFRSIPSGKLRRYWDVRNLIDLVVVKWAFWVALIRLIRWRPAVVVGAGSFVQVPVMWAAWLLRIPIFIHQLDVRPSLANRLVAPFASQITVTFPESAKAFHNAEIVGAPVRAAILVARDLNARDAKRRFGFTGDRPVLLILGGGTGAAALNELVWQSLPLLTPHADVIHVIGRGKDGFRPTVSVSKLVSSNGVVRRNRLTPPIRAATPPTNHHIDHYRSFELLTDDLPYAYAAADLVVSRAGMGAISELAALGKPMVLIPMPGTHQDDNASAVRARGAAEVWDERGLTPEAFAARTTALLTDPGRRTALSRACTSVLPTDAGAEIAAIIREIMNRNVS